MERASEAGNSRTSSASSSGRSIWGEWPQCTVRRYRSRRRARADRAPVLLVPPLAAPSSCFDLHRDCSLAQHLTAMGYPVYLVDYGAIG